MCRNNIMYGYRDLSDCSSGSLMSIQKWTVFLEYFLLFLGKSFSFSFVVLSTSTYSSSFVNNNTNWIIETVEETTWILWWFQFFWAWHVWFGFGSIVTTIVLYFWFFFVVVFFLRTANKKMFKLKIFNLSLQLYM